MTQFDTSAFLSLLPLSALAVLVVLAITFACAKAVGKHSVIDTAWGLLFVAIAGASLVGSAGHGDALRRWLLFAMTAVWGLRLAVHVGRRNHGQPEDPRYRKLLAGAHGHPDLYALRSIYVTQGLLAYVVSAPIQVGSFLSGPVRLLGWLGVAVYVMGLGFEAVGDAQLKRWRAHRPAGAAVIDVGLWRYTRHPNYFGDACVWWGIFLVAAERWPGVLTVASPIIMTLLLTVGSGVRILEQHMRSRPGWDAYAARTSAFVPWPPRRS